MAETFNTTTYGKQLGTGATPLLPDASIVNGKLRFAAIEYALAGTEVATDIINLVRLKAGVRIVPALSRIVCEDPGTALTLDIGFASNDDAILDGGALSTAHNVDLIAAASATGTATWYNLAKLDEGDELIFATVKTATTITAGAKLLFLIAYLDE